MVKNLKTRGIDLIIDTPLPTLVCERLRMRQVFQNLVDNAIKYMGDGSGQPDQDTTRIEKDSRRLPDEADRSRILRARHGDRDRQG